MIQKRFLIAAIFAQKNSLFFVAGIFTILLIMSSCSKEDLNISNDEKQELQANQQSDGFIVLGKKLEDPYALKNMKKAYSNLKSTKSGTPDVDIQPTHLYLRFLPKNEQEWSILKSDTSFVLYDYPLNYEIVNMGTYYHDPSLPDSAITYQYCVVPIGYEIPNVQNELLYEVYIPSIEDTTTSKGSSINQFLADLEYESVRITGNLTQNNFKNAKGLLPSKWTPKGTITVWDDLLSRYIPLVQASVHARWFTHIETDLTDNNGYFQTSQFRYEVNYAIKWERSYYDIRNGNFLQAWFNGPKQKGDWNLNIRGGESVMYATMHRAAYKHFYGDNLGIRRPILMDGSKTKICYIDEYGTGVFWGDWSAGGILPDIKIWGKNSSGNYKPTNQIFGTTAHELGHQSHSQYMGNIQFWQTSKIIYESWADAVEWALSNDEYHKLGNKYFVATAINYNHIYNNHNSWPFVNDKAYSPIFIDLIDNRNQRVLFGSDYPNDLITGYTLSYINYNILRNSYGLSSLHEAIKNNKITGVTDSDVDELFALYW